VEEGKERRETRRVKEKTKIEKTECEDEERGLFVNFFQRPFRKNYTHVPVGFVLPNMSLSCLSCHYTRSFAPVNWSRVQQYVSYLFLTAKLEHHLLEGNHL
jgi:hypothetical protein